jgi:hypothetical protein
MALCLEAHLPVTPSWGCLAGRLCCILDHRPACLCLEEISAMPAILLRRILLHSGRKEEVAPETILPGVTLFPACSPRMLRLTLLGGWWPVVRLL